MRLSFVFISLFFCSAIFAFDYLFNLSAFCLAYIIYILLSYAVNSKTYNIVSSFLLSFTLCSIGFLFSSREIIESVNLYNLIIFKVNYELLFRYSSLILLSLISILLFIQKNKDEKLEKINSSLELRILARTVSSENRVRLLEEQIDILQNLKNKKINDSIYNLDNVILQLKKISEMEE